jgi:hypothetical protein
LGSEADDGNGRYHTFTEENLAYIRLVFILSVAGETWESLPNSTYCITRNDLNIKYEPYGVELVGGLMQYCFTIATDTVEETIKKAFEDAIEECWWYE